MNDRDDPAPVPVPHTALSGELLQAVAESFVLREGTDYGAHELSLAEKVARLVRQLERGEAQIVYDPRTDSVHITAVR
jgi:uncharacterized protein